MKFIESGKPRKDYLYETTKLKPVDKIGNILLDKFDYFIGFLEKQKSDMIHTFIANIIKKFQTLSKDDYWNSTSKEIIDKFQKYDNIKQNTDLQKAALNYFVHLLQVGEEDWKKDEIKISRKALIQAWTFPSYYLLETLAETIGREDAIELFKQYITQYHIDHPSPYRDKFVDLENRFEERTSGDTSSSEWVIVHAMLEDGKYAIKNKNCPTCADVSSELPDVEFKYLAFCYGDYAAFRAGMSDHIILTMEHTIIQGDSYCSRVMHDTRIDWDLTHPPKEFWDRMEPGNEKEALEFYKKKYE